MLNKQFEYFLLVWLRNDSDHISSGFLPFGFNVITLHYIIYNAYLASRQSTKP